MSHLSFTQRIAILVAMFLLSVVAVLLMAPIPQDPGYHRFADSRPFLGIANFGDVTSNLGFAAVGVMGLCFVTGPRRRALFDAKQDAWPYQTFFAAVGLVFA